MPNSPFRTEPSLCSGAGEGCNLGLLRTLSHVFSSPSQRWDPPPLPESGKAERPQQQDLGVRLSTDPASALSGNCRNEETEHTTAKSPTGRKCCDPGAPPTGGTKNLQAGWPGPDHWSEGSPRAGGQLGSGRARQLGCKKASRKSEQTVSRETERERGIEHESKEKRKEMRNQERERGGQPGRQ